LGKRKKKKKPDEGKRGGDNTPEMITRHNAGVQKKREDKTSVLPTQKKKLGNQSWIGKRQKETRPESRSRKPAATKKKSPQKRKVHPRWGPPPGFMGSPSWEIGRKEYIGDKG